jgi:hypothetical protein
MALFHGAVLFDAGVNGHELPQDRTFNSMLAHLMHGQFDVDPNIVGSELVQSVTGRSKLGSGAQNHSVICDRNLPWVWANMIELLPEPTGYAKTSRPAQRVATQRNPVVLNSGKGVA